MKFASCVDKEKDIQDFWTLNKKKIKKFYLAQQKADDVIISASPRFLLFPICEELGIRHLICSEVSMETGKFTGLNCHSEEKVRRFHQEFGNAEVDKFYSDSLSDTPMAKLAKKAYLVKGEELLDWKF